MAEPAPFPSEDEAYNLKIPKSTLTPEEREIINNHMVTTIRMLGKPCPGPSTCAGYRSTPAATTNDWTARATPRA